MDEEFPSARKVVTRAPARTVRVLNLGGILHGPVECESSLERDFVYRAALCPSVVLIKHQPFRVNWAAGKHYTPDFLVRHRDGQVTVVEVKLAERAAAYRELFDRAATDHSAQQHARAGSADPPLPKASTSSGRNRPGAGAPPPRTRRHAFSPAHAGVHRVPGGAAAPHRHATPHHLSRLACGGKGARLHVRPRKGPP